MGNVARLLDLIDDVAKEGLKRGIGLLRAEDEVLDGRSVRIRSQDRLNFASCSYLGLELDERLKAGAIDAVERFGTQFSASRAYLSAPLYEELEQRMGQITGGHCVVTPTTTLAHFVALPLLVGEDDAVILDHQVHHSVQMVMPQLRQIGATIEFLRHDRLDQLEERVRALKGSHRKIWFLCDGVYSMHGDLAPMPSLRRLLASYEQLHLYVDDAHGVSWYGENGRGIALEGLPERDRCVVALSLNKAFGAGGGALVLPNAEMVQRMRSLGGPMFFSGPLQPPVLGAAIASARIHMSDELEPMKQELRDRIRYANQVAEELDLPFANRCEVPVRYVALGRSSVTMDMTQQLLERGFLANCAAFPAVPAKGSGLRFTVTRHQRMEDIRAMLETVAELLPGVLEANDSSREEIERHFQLAPAEKPRRRRSDLAPARSDVAREVSVQCEKSIRAIDREEWDRCLGARGTFSWEGLRMLEDVFGPGAQAEEDKDSVDRWDFHYYIVRDETKQPVLATFFTSALMKDDMLESAEVSRRVERAREGDPRFLVSRVMTMGSLLTEGDHLYLRRDGEWRRALTAVLEEVELESQAQGATSVMLRDLPAGDAELDAALAGAGFSRMDCPASMELAVNWSSWAEHLEELRPSERRFQKKEIAPHEGSFDVQVLGQGSELSSEEIERCYALYRNVQARSLDLNTFPLPQRFFERVLSHEGWELVTLTLKEEKQAACEVPLAPGPHAVIASYRGADHYAPLVIGLDYEAVAQHSVYRQALREVVRRGESLGVAKVLLGMGAQLEKARFGARPVKRSIYAMAADHYNHDVLNLIAQEVNQD